MTHSKKLVDFLVEYKEWLKRPEGLQFSKTQGLCRNLDVWKNYNDVSMYVVDELDELLATHKGVEFGSNEDEDKYPFNDGYRDFSRECASAEAHLNPLRIKWVNETIKELLSQEAS